MQGWLQEALRERLKYFRRDKTPGRPGSERKGIVPTKPPKHQMPHITAVPCIMDSIGEDEASHERHKKILSLEWKKSKPNKHAVSELMRRTFTARRERILSSPVPMESLLSTYPPLKQYKEVSDIFIPFVSDNSVGYCFVACVGTGQNSRQAGFSRD